MALSSMDLSFAYAGDAHVYVYVPTGIDESNVYSESTLKTNSQILSSNKDQSYKLLSVIPFCDKDSAEYGGDNWAGVGISVLEFCQANPRLLACFTKKTMCVEVWDVY